MNTSGVVDYVSPIETIYNGYRFRSRLEARWAVFFDSLGLAYEYEMEGFELGSAGRFLPDFWLPALNCWIEVKPSGWPSDPPATRKIHALARAGHWVVVVSGLPLQGHALLCCPDGTGGLDGGFVEFGESVRSGEIILIYAAASLAMAAQYARANGIRVAANRASSARFEFGESGPPRGQA